MAYDHVVTIGNLKPCTSYEVQVQSECSGLYTDYSSVFKFTTDGCGSCTQVSYCSANAGQSTGEWIESVVIGNWLQNSGPGGGGYQNFTGDQYTPLQLHPEDTLAVVVTPDFPGATNKEYFRIYVDFNADGDFDDPGELAFDPGYASNEAIFGSFKTPFFTYAGLTRMRVLMKAKNATNQAPDPCESFDFGQIEDYCVLLDPGSGTETPGALDGKLKIFPQPAFSTATLEWPETSSEKALLQVWNMAGQRVWTQNTEGGQHQILLQTTDWQPGIYRVSLQTETGIWQEKLLKM